MPREATALVREGDKKRLKGNDFIPYVYEAIRRAEEGHVEGDDLPKDLSSNVYLLVKKLVIPNVNG